MVLLIKNCYYSIVCHFQPTVCFNQLYSNLHLHKDVNTDDKCISRNFFLDKKKYYSLNFGLKNTF